MGTECYFSEDSEERRARKIVSLYLETLQIIVNIMNTEIRILKAILVRLQMEPNKICLETIILDIKCQGT